MIYLDNSSTTRQDDRVTEVMLSAMQEDFGNPSSLHPMGLAAQNRITKARKQIAEVLSADPSEIIFTSGGTESDNNVLFGIAQARRHQGNKIITTKVEHPAILEPCKQLEQQGFSVVYLDVDEKGYPDMEQYASELDDKTILVSMMAVNNELGTILPIRKAAEMAHQAGALFHTDGVQALGKVSLQNTGADFISLSGHKIHGPKGVGVLYASKKVHLPALIVGGGQEKNRRSGTENVPGIVGMGEAVAQMKEELAQCEKAQKGQDATGMPALRQHLLEGLKANIDNIRINSPESLADGAASVLNVSFIGTRGEVILHTLEGDGIYVSTGSACSSNKKGRSHVLEAIGCSDKEIEGAIRFSLSRFNTIEEMDVVIEKVKQAVDRFRLLGSFR